MDILILGGTRFLGRHLTEVALNYGHNVSLFNRGNNPNVFPELEQIKGNRDSDLAGLNGRKWDAVIDTCGFIPRTVSHSAKILNQANHYTYISSGSVYKNLNEQGIDENAEVHTLSPVKLEEITRGAAGPIYGEYYGHLKALSEKSAEKEMPGKVLVVRAGQLVGPYDYTDRLPYWVKRIAQGGEVLAPGRPERPIQIIDTKDLAKWIIRMIEKNVTGTFNAIGPEDTLTMKELLQQCVNVINPDTMITWATENFLLENQVQPWGEMPLWIPEEFPLEGQNKPWNGFFSVSNKKALDHGLTFRSLSEIIQDIYAWEKKRSQNEKRKAGMESKREKELLKKWKKVKI